MVMLTLFVEDILSICIDFIQCDLCRATNKLTWRNKLTFVQTKSEVFFSHCSMWSEYIKVYRAVYHIHKSGSLYKQGLQTEHSLLITMQVNATINKHKVPYRWCHYLIWNGCEIKGLARTPNQQSELKLFELKPVYNMHHHIKGWAFIV